MIATLLWKEYREHRAPWLMLAAVGVGGLLGLAALLAPQGDVTGGSVGEMLQAVAVLLAWTYGMVCGSMLLAGERENNTLTFLDILPVSRLRLWLVKLGVGAALLVAQVGVLAGLFGWQHWFSGPGHAVVLVLLMIFVGLLGLAWGLLFSARGQNVLNVIGLAIAGQLGAWFVLSLLLVPVEMVARVTHFTQPLVETAFGIVALLVLTIGPLVLSAHVFNEPDRLRRLAALRSLDPATGSRAIHRPTPPIRRLFGWRELFWLSFRQVGRLAIGLALFCLALGFLLPRAGVLMWPSLTLFIGVLCGVTAFSDEQMMGSFRFLGDQRFPLGRIWAVKVAVRFVLACGATLLLFLPAGITALTHGPNSNWPQEGPPYLSRVFHSTLVSELIPGGIFLTMGLLYGFSAGQLFGLLFRKSLVAAVVAFGCAGLFLTLWLPSLLSGGLHFWQIAVVPLLILVFARLLMPAWAAGQLLARRTLVRLGCAAVAAGLWTTFALWYRAAEVPVPPSGYDLAAFKASLPVLEKNSAGQKTRGALGRLSELWQLRGQETATRPLFPNERVEPGQIPFRTQAYQVLERGWPAAGRANDARVDELAGWLDRMFESDWPKDLAEAARESEQNPGVVEDPRNVNLTTPQRLVEPARVAALLLVVRGLQDQALGHDQLFLDYLATGLSLSRDLQRDSPSVTASTGRTVEWIFLQGLERWLEKLRARPQQLRTALAVLLKHEAELPPDSQHNLADYLVAWNTLNEVPDALAGRTFLRNRGQLFVEDASQHDFEVSLINMAWQVPWERERHERLLRVFFEGTPAEAFAARDMGLQEAASLSHLALGVRKPINTCLLHASQLRLALRLYEAENGRPARTLDVLIPAYLDHVPTDPFDGKPFRYRLSAGEAIVWSGNQSTLPPGHRIRRRAGDGPRGAPVLPGGFAEEMMDVPAGQGILWSVGDDRTDNGAHRQGNLSTGTTSGGEDLIYLVPRPVR
jgi:hypothetical protein